MSHPFSAPELRAGNPGVILGFCLPLSAPRLLSAESFWVTHKTQLLDLLCGPAVAACGTGQAQGLVRAEICPSPPSGRFRPGFPLARPSSWVTLSPLPASSLGPQQCLSLCPRPSQPEGSASALGVRSPLRGPGSLENAPEAPPRAGARSDLQVSGGLDRRVASSLSVPRVQPFLDFSICLERLRIYSSSVTSL